eukprot:SAG11_NODE_1030_length_6119_cov_7.559302_1_plen_41_part_00
MYRYMQYPLDPAVEERGGGGTDRPGREWIGVSNLPAFSSS